MNERMNEKAFRFINLSSNPNVISETSCTRYESATCGAAAWPWQQVAAAPNSNRRSVDFMSTQRRCRRTRTYKWPLCLCGFSASPLLNRVDVVLEGVPMLCDEVADVELDHRCGDLGYNIALVLGEASLVLVAKVFNRAIDGLLKRARRCRLLIRWRAPRRLVHGVLLGIYLWRLLI